MRFALVFLLVVTLANGCGSRDEKANTQVAAQVNGAEITIHQVNNVLARAPNVTPEVASKAKREILERLVGQELAKQQAIEKKLDRTPVTVQAIESAKSEILARAYLEQVAAAEAKPSPDEIKRYYADNPELFAQRRIFHIQEMLVRGDAAVARSLREQAAKGQSMQSIATWLKSRNAQFIQNERILAAEEVPLISLKALFKAKEGEFQVNEAPDRISVLRVVSVRAAPIDEAAATPRIQQFLASQRANQAVAREMKRLKEIAKIDYRGEFSTESAAVPPASAASPVPQAKPSSAEPSSGTEASGFDKGIRGLK